MIRRVYSDLPTFKNLNFHPGLNVLLADTTPGATERQTRNRAGKSSFTEILHFMLGGNVDKGSIFREPVLHGQKFGLVLDLGEETVNVERVPENRSILEVVGGKWKNWPIQPSTDKKTGQTCIKNTLWKDVLGHLFFDLPESVDKFGPTSRSLISYFVRRQSTNGYLDHQRQSENQNLYDQQVALTYMLGLDWRIPQHWQKVREREKSLKELKKAVKGGALGDIILSTADIRTKLTVIEAHAEKLKANLSEFKVLPEYRELEIEASQLTRQISQHSDENTIDRQVVDDLESSLEEESQPPSLNIEEVYQEAGIVLPGIALRRFDDVREFHESVLSNRKYYLDGEITSARQRIAKREQAIEKIEERRSQIMKLLRSHGALDHFTKLQSELTRFEQDIVILKKRYETAEALETGKTEQTLERQQLLLRLRQNHREQKETLREAILAFEEISNSLYEDAGSLHIAESENGPTFEIKIQGNRSKGINNMQIFCFDLMLMKLCAKRGIGPGFLVHDSHLFDGVDERQIATALHVGETNAEEMGYQYIVTMNSDTIPEKLPNGFNLSKHVLPIRLTDDTEDGGLFGIRFG